MIISCFGNLNYTVTITGKKTMKSPPLAMHWWALASCPSVAGWSQSQQELHAGITPGLAESAKKLMFNRVTWTITISIFKGLGNLNHHKWDCKVLRDLRKDYSTVVTCMHGFYQQYKQVAQPVPLTFVISTVFHKRKRVRQIREDPEQKWDFHMEM